jgi:hypothetical protein
VPREIGALRQLLWPIDNNAAALGEVCQAAQSTLSAEFGGKSANIDPRFLHFSGSRRWELNACAAHGAGREKALSGAAAALAWAFAAALFLTMALSAQPRRNRARRRQYQRRAPATRPSPTAGMVNVDFSAGAAITNLGSNFLVGRGNQP